MKYDLFSWYQGLVYEEGLGPGEVLFFQQKNRRINSWATISNLIILRNNNSLAIMGFGAPLF